MHRHTSISIYRRICNQNKTVKKNENERIYWKKVYVRFKQCRFVYIQKSNVSKFLCMLLPTNTLKLIFMKVDDLSYFCFVCWSIVDSNLLLISAWFESVTPIWFYNNSKILKYNTHDNSIKTRMSLYNLWILVLVIRGRRSEVLYLYIL